MHATSATDGAPSGASVAGCERGFTLMELLVVLAILVLLTSALPLALDHALPGRRVEATTQKLLAAIRNAQLLSAARGTPVRLELEGSRLSGDRLSVHFPATTRVEIKDAEGATLRAVSAFPEGTLTEAHITVSERSQQRTLHLSGLTGRVVVEAPAHAR